MANSDRVGVWPCVSAFRPNLKQLCVLLASLNCAAGAAVQAAQVTFAFDATVTQINATPGFAETLPFVPSVGQTMSGVVTFTPVPFGQLSDNDAKLEIAWAGETFAGASIQLVTLNDHLLGPGFPFDALGLECRVTESCAVTSFDITLRDLALGLKSSQNVVPGGQLMDSVHWWNQFEDRELLLFLSNPDDTKAVNAIAEVGAMRLIPEPASVALVTFAVFLVGVCRSNKREQAGGHSIFSASRDGRTRVLAHGTNRTT